MRVDLLTREYPAPPSTAEPVSMFLELAKVLRGLVDDLRVQAFDGLVNPEPTEPIRG